MASRSDPGHGASGGIEACRVCGHGSGRDLIAFGRRYRRCGACGTLQLVLTEEDYRNLNPGYDPGVYLKARTPGELRAFLDVERRKALLREALGWAGLSPAGGRFLDVGCGMGAYLVAATELGMTARGFEPSRDHSDVARSLLGLDVTLDYFTAAHVGDARFDLVLLSHVIEHIYWPSQMIEDLLAVLAPGGCLVVITPNAQSLIARLCGGRWPMLMPIDHVTMLGPDGLSRLVPPGFEACVSTSEYPYEFLATLGSVAKAALRGGSTVAGPAQPAASGSAVKETGLPSRLLRAGLAAGSLPVHLLGRATGKAAALRMFVRRPGAAPASA